MLIELAGGGAHEEDTWIGRRIELGETVISISKPDARCAITTQDPDTGARDLDTLRTIIAYRGLRDGENVDFGVYGDVVEPAGSRLRIRSASWRSATSRWVPAHLAAQPPLGPDGRRSSDRTTLVSRARRTGRRGRARVTLAGPSATTPSTRR